MNYIETDIEDLFVLKPTIFGDERGYFIESYNQSSFNENIVETLFVQDNESKSSFGVLRGLHFQKPPFDQAKLVRVIEGEVLDVVVDIRRSSKTYGKVFSIILNETNKHQLFVPRGFAHGFVVLSEKAIFSYKVDNFYSPSHEGGIMWNDAFLNIDWKIDPLSVLLSEKDKKLSDFSNFNSPFL